MKLGPVHPVAAHRAINSINIFMKKEVRFESVRLRTIRVCYATAHSQNANPPQSFNTSGRLKNRNSPGWMKVVIARMRSPLSIST